MDRSKSRNWAGLLTVMVAGILLAGCTSWGYDPSIRGNWPTEDFNLGKIQAAVPASPHSFNDYLVVDYAAFAVFLRDQHDWTDVDYFARKGLAASRGQSVPPETTSVWLLPPYNPPGVYARINTGRARLITLLDGGGRDRFPALAASAQTKFDCWQERTENDWNKGPDGACSKEFAALLDQLDAALHGPAKAAPLPPEAHSYRVYFDFDKAAILPEAQQIIDRVAKEAKETPKVQVHLVGKADLSGTDQYNLELSHRRADAVRAALVADGIPTEEIQESWVGLREPPVPTGAGAREPRNRVVEVNLLQ